MRGRLSHWDTLGHSTWWWYWKWCRNNSLRKRWRKAAQRFDFFFIIIFLFTTVSAGHCLWSKTVPLFCLFLTQLWHVVSTWSTADLLRGSQLVKEVHFQGCSCSYQNSIIDFTSRGTQGSQGPWQFYLRKKLKGFESPRMDEEESRGEEGQVRTRCAP